jgi:hypothetical protein
MGTVSRTERSRGVAASPWGAACVRSGVGSCSREMRRPPDPSLFACNEERVPHDWIGATSMMDWVIDRFVLALACRLDDLRRAILNRVSAEPRHHGLVVTAMTCSIATRRLRR